MKPHTSAARSISNSTESLKLKKSSSSQFNNKMKNSVTTLTTLTSCMDSSVKQQRIHNSSKSNKKPILQNNSSNKSIKSLNETHSQSRLDHNKKVICKKVEATVVPEKKGTAVNIKTMKQRALGGGHGTANTNISGHNHQNTYKTHTRCTEEK